jgi:formylmethanofuran dehydrogenase subunit E
MEMTDELVKEIAEIDMVCDQCGEEIKAGTPYYADMKNGKIYCPDCFA